MRSLSASLGQMQVARPRLPKTILGQHFLCGQEVSSGYYMRRGERRGDGDGDCPGVTTVGREAEQPVGVRL